MAINLRDAFSNKASPVKSLCDKYRIENTFDDEWECNTIISPLLS